MDLLHILTQLNDKGAYFESLTESINTKSPAPVGHSIPSTSAGINENKQKRGSYDLIRLARNSAFLGPCDNQFAEFCSHQTESARPGRRTAD